MTKSSDDLEKNVDIEYYNLQGKELHMLLPPGDLIKICNVLHDYTDLLETYIDEYKDDIGKAVTVANYKIYSDRLKKIQTNIEDTIGYSTSAAIEKCRKKALKQKENSDIGEDALVLASKARAARKNTEKEKVEADRFKRDNRPDVEKNQISLFEFMKSN